MRSKEIINNVPEINYCEFDDPRSVAAYRAAIGAGVAIPSGIIMREIKARTVERPI